jgi:hypothetical protein
MLEPPQEVLHSAYSAEKTDMTNPRRARTRHFLRPLANRFDNMSNAASIVNRHFKSAA